MANPIFDKFGQNNKKSGSIFDILYNRLYDSNPQFRDFANNAKGKSIEDLCMQYGIDPKRVTGMSQEDVLSTILTKMGKL